MRTNQRLPPRGSCRRRRLKESARLSVFRRFSVPRSPFVTLSRDTFLPEEGSCLRAALPQKENVRTFGFEALHFAPAFSAAQSQKTYKLTALLR